MRKLLIYLVIAGVLGSLTLSWYFLAGKNYHTQAVIKFTSANIPFTEIEIGGKTYFLEVDLGSKFPLTLRKSLLEKIHPKQPHGIGEWKDAAGNNYATPSYLIPKIKIGDLILKEVIAQQEDDEYLFNSTIWDEENKGRNIPDFQQGSIGWSLLKTKNLLLDLQHSIFLISNDKNKLDKAGYVLDDLIKTAFEMEKIGIILNIKTDLGVKRFSLDTGSTLNLIKSSLAQNNPCKKEKHGVSIFTTSIFAIGEKDFGETDLHLYDIAPSLDLDGVLGMPFLENHTVYIDFQNRLAYISPTKQGANLVSTH